MSIKIRAGKLSLQVSFIELFVLGVLLVFGTVYSLMIPVMAGSDEDQHLLRVWEMSTFDFIPNEKLAAGQIPFPMVYNRMSLHALPYGGIVQPDFWKQYAGLPIDAFDYVYGSLTTRSIYTPTLLLPQALVMRYLGRRLGMPALTVFYLCRIIGLLSYAALAWLAVRLIPFGKWTFAILVLSPMALFQASIVTADSISNGIDFLFIGGTLALVFQEKIRWKELVFFAGLFFLLFMAKTNTIFLGLLPFLFLSPARFKMKGGYWILAGIALLLFLIEVVGWNWMVYSHPAASGALDIPGQLRFVLSHPFQFLRTILFNFWENTGPYLRQWIGVYGYGYSIVPSAVYAFFALSLAATFWLQGEGATPDRKIRVWSVVVFVISYLITVGALYLAFTPVGFYDILGVQGRYFIPIMPLLLLAGVGWIRSRRVRLVSAVSAVSLITSLSFYGAGIALSYYVPCGTMDYTAGMCYQPLYKHWNPDAAYSPPVSGGLSLVQQFQPICDGMTEVRLWINTSGSAPGGKTEFMLQDSVGGAVLVESSVSNSALPVGAWYPLKFDPDWKSARATFTLSIHAEDPHSIPGPRLATYDQTSINTPSSLEVNGQQVAPNLIYQYGCIAGLEKISWTLGRPGR